MGIRENINFFREILAGRNCRMVVISKTRTPEEIMEAYTAGHRIFGENKVQELTTRHEILPQDIEWHMVGHLQTNKVKYLSSFITLIHSVDSLRLLMEIHKQAKRSNRVIDCLVQVHIASEETKFGFSPGELMDFFNDPVLPGLSAIRIRGFMGMASFTDDMEKIRREFRTLRNIFEHYQNNLVLPNVLISELSIGMSGDYKIALEEGSTLIRIGTSIFGQREYEHY